MNWERGRSWGWGRGVKKNQGMSPTPRQRRPLLTRPAPAWPFWVQMLVCLAHNQGTPKLPNTCFGPRKGTAESRCSFLNCLLYIQHRLRMLWKPLLLSASPRGIHLGAQFMMQSERKQGPGLMDNSVKCHLVTNVCFFSKRRKL